MLTRRRVRTWLPWIGLSVGIAAFSVMLLTCFVSIRWADRRGMMTFSGGAIIADWPYFPNRDAGVTTTPRSSFWWLPYYATQYGQGGRIVFPLWIPILIGLYCAYRLLPEGYARGRCQKCGYDLQGVPECDREMDLSGMWQRQHESSPRPGRVILPFTVH